MYTADIRAAFIDFFRDKHHHVQPSASLIPASDPSLLFVNAGMVPFKSYFLGEQPAPFTCATSSQRCLRVGGKHNDLENVGFTARHHTLFEMLGNFSFGAYDKKQAIAYAWEFLTEKLKISKDKLLVTVYHEDKESADIWQQSIGLPKSKIIACGEADNFWSMGETGPCGPCTEIFYDHGPNVDGGPPGTETADGDRYVEIWNLVFMEFDRRHDGSLHPLPQRCVDTGMGLERISAVMQGVHNNFDTDIFKKIMQATQALSKHVPLTTQRIIADHMRAICWLIVDQVRPSNEGRGYVLRRIIRRALRFAFSAQMEIPCLYKLVDAVIDEYSFDPHMRSEQATIIEVLRTEETLFSHTIRNGMVMFEQSLVDAQNKTIAGDVVFKLHDTFGFPHDLVVDLAKEKGFNVDLDGYEHAMAAQKSRSRQHKKFADTADSMWHIDGVTDFCGYETNTCSSEVLGIYSDTQGACDNLKAGDVGRIVLQKTPFYAEAGGQVGDTGSLRSDQGYFIVQDTQKHRDCIVHFGVLSTGQLQVGDLVEAQVDSKRDPIKKNHSATHLLHAALRAVLGTHVSQKGSLVSADKCRFDFSHTQALTKDEWNKVEDLVNQNIIANHPITTQVMPIEKAKEMQVMALFTEKYDDEVRVLTMGDFSQELCGGIHCKYTGEIGVFVIKSESAVAQGVRRLEAITGMRAYRYLQLARNNQNEAQTLLQAHTDDWLIKLADQHKKLKITEKALQATQVQATQAKLVKQAQASKVKIADTDCVLLALPSELAADMRLGMDGCMQALPSSICVLYVAQKDRKFGLAIGIGQTLRDTYNAKTLFQDLARNMGARGGGKQDYAQGQLPVDNPQDLHKILLDWLHEKIEG